MGLLDKLEPGVRLYDRRTDHERLVDKVEVVGQFVCLSLKHPQTDDIERQSFPLVELESRFEILVEEEVVFQANPEAHRLHHAFIKQNVNVKFPKCLGLRSRLDARQ